MQKIKKNHLEKAQQKAKQLMQMIRMKSRKNVPDTFDS